MRKPTGRPTGRPKSGNPRTHAFMLRLTTEEQEQLRVMARDAGFATIASFVRYKLDLPATQEAPL